MLKRALQLVTVLAALAAVAVGASAIADAASSASINTARRGSDANPVPPAPRAGQAPLPGPYPGERALSAGTADRVRKAALAKVPGDTVLRVETDAQGSPYEAHLRKSDGSIVTVKVDKQFDATAVQNGLGAGPGGNPPASSQ
jgi:hypothetical protein